MLEQLEERTWGVVLFEERDGRRFVLLPRGMVISRPLRLGGRLAFELPN